MFSELFSTVPVLDRLPQFDPTNENSHIRAGFIDGAEFDGKPTRFFAYVGVPSHAPGERLPGVVLLHGGGGHAYCKWVRLWNERGFAAIAPDLGGYIPKAVNAGSEEDGTANWVRVQHDNDGYADFPHPSEMRDYKLPAGQQWMYHQLAAAILSANYLRTLGDVDCEKIGVTGISWGGVATALLIGYDPRFAFAVPIYGCGYIGENRGLLGSIYHDCFCSGQWIAEERFGSVRMPLLWQGWNSDWAFPPDNVTHSFRSTEMGNPLTAISLIDEMNHSHCYAWDRPEPYIFAAAVCKNSPLPKIISPSFDGDAVRFSLDGFCSPRAELFWFDAPLTYGPPPKEGWPNPWIQNQWKKQTVEIHSGEVAVTVPDEARLFYVSLTDNVAGEEYTVCTGTFER